MVVVVGLILGALQKGAHPRRPTEDRPRHRPALRGIVRQLHAHRQPARLFAATAGADVNLTFNNSSNTQQHNWVLVASGTKDDVAVAGLSASSNGWIPVDDDRIIAHTELINAGETGEVQFTAPAAGTYQFVCTFPGHNGTMFGDFVVVP